MRGRYGETTNTIRDWRCTTWQPAEAAVFILFMQLKLSLAPLFSFFLDPCNGCEEDPRSRWVKAKGIFLTIVSVYE